MIIYAVPYQDTRTGNHIQWARSKAAIPEAKRIVRAEYRRHNCTQDFEGFGEPFAMDVLPGKQGLIDWLNKELPSYNN
jgi:hypothetical protein